MTTEIKLKQSSIIEHKLKEAGQSVLERINALELDKMIITEDSVKSFKKTRAELNKEFAEFESQKKAIKEAVLAPYTEFESLYKIEISDRYKEAENQLKDGIYNVESKLKAEKRDNLKIYFDELIESFELDFLTFEAWGIDINLSTTEKKYKESAYEFVEKIKSDVQLIKTQGEIEAEVLVEYKKHFNVSKAIQEVTERKRLEQGEKDKKALELLKTRQKDCLLLGMKWDEMTNVFAFSNDIYISKREIETLSEREFSAKILQCKLDIDFVSNPIESNIQPAVKAPIIAESAPKLLTAKFEISDTIERLTMLKNFLIENNFNYKNIK